MDAPTRPGAVTTAYAAQHCRLTDPQTAARHDAAFHRAITNLNATGAGLLAVLVGLARVADAHFARWHAPIGHDGVAGLAFLNAANALVTLLCSTETGDLDCGTLAHAIETICTDNGIGLYEGTLFRAVPYPLTTV